jgi:hypothetical protein
METMQENTNGNRDRATVKDELSKVRAYALTASESEFDSLIEKIEALEAEFKSLPAGPRGRVAGIIPSNILIARRKEIRNEICCELGGELVTVAGHDGEVMETLGGLLVGVPVGIPSHISTSSI